VPDLFLMIPRASGRANEVAQTQLQLLRAPRAWWSST
jgi:hypothetical protein